MRIVIFSYLFILSTVALGKGPGDPKKKSISAVGKGKNPTPAEMFEKQNRGKRWVCRINQSR